VDGSIGITAVLRIPPSPLNGNLGGVIATDYSAAWLETFIANMNDTSTVIDFTLIDQAKGLIIGSTLSQQTRCTKTLATTSDVPSIAAAAEPIIARFLTLVGPSYYAVSNTFYVSSSDVMTLFLTAPLLQVKDWVGEVYYPPAELFVVMLQEVKGVIGANMTLLLRANKSSFDLYFVEKKLVAVGAGVGFLLVHPWLVRLV
jgi:hypothetical protein